MTGVNELATGTPKAARGYKPGQCKVCASGRRHEIDVALVNHVPVRTLERRYGIPRSCIHRHGRNHLSPQMRAAILLNKRPTEIDLDKLKAEEGEGLLTNLIAQRARLQSLYDQSTSLRSHAGLCGY